MKEKLSSCVKVIEPRCGRDGFALISCRRTNIGQYLQIIHLGEARSASEARLILEYDMSGSDMPLYRAKRWQVSYDCCDLVRIR